MAKVFGSRLFVLHIIDDTVVDAFSMSGIPFEDYRGTIEQRARESLERFVQENIKGFENFDVILKMGNPFEEIISTARELNISLIVMGSHGRTGIERALFGSTAEKVVRYAPCPVFTVRERE